MDHLALVSAQEMAVVKGQVMAVEMAVGKELVKAGEKDWVKDLG